jgi:hypothetical protein
VPPQNAGVIVLHVSGNAPGMTTLAKAIKGKPPAEFADLSDEEATALAGLVEHAAAERARLIDRAIEDSLRHLPALVRGPVKRALGI